MRALALPILRRRASAALKYSGSSPVDLKRSKPEVFSAMVYHGNTIMAVQAGTDTRSWHSAVMRLWQSNAIAYGVPGQVDLTEIPALTWGGYRHDPSEPPESYQLPMFAKFSRRLSPTLEIYSPRKPH